MTLPILLLASMGGGVILILILSPKKENIFDSSAAEEYNHTRIDLLYSHNYDNTIDLPIEGSDLIVHPIDDVQIRR